MDIKRTMLMESSDVCRVYLFVGDQRHGVIMDIKRAVLIMPGNVCQSKPIRLIGLWRKNNISAV